MDKYGITADSDNTILNSEAEVVVSLNVVGRGIERLSGIEAFTSLTSLDCWLNQLAILDVSSNMALTDLDCSSNRLMSLNVSSNMALTDLDCTSNRLMSLNVSSNTALTDLICASNSLAILDVSSNTALTDLDCSDNSLAILDVSSNTALLVSLDVSSNTALTDLICSSNSLTRLNVSANTELTQLLCINSQQLTSLNVQNGNNPSLFINVSGNPNLTCIQVDDAGNTPSGWVKDATAVYSEGCTTAIPDDNFEQALIDLGIDNNGKNNSILNSEAEAVVSLTIIAKDIENLSGIEAFTSLTSLDCWLNQLAILDVSSNMALTDLDCSSNRLMRLNVSSNMVLTDLDCTSNRLMSLNVSSNTALTDLICASNSLARLNVSANTELTQLLCINSQQLTSLNVQNGNNPSLFINVSGNPNLTCIQVDDAGNVPGSWVKDATVVYSEDCSILLSSEDFKLSGVSISPNPTSGILNITAPEKAGYRLLNIRGQTLKKGILPTGEGKINISSFAKGVYLLNIKTDKGSFTKKVVRN